MEHCFRNERHNIPFKIEGYGIYCEVCKGHETGKGMRYIVPSPIGLDSTQGLLYDTLEKRVIE